MMQTLNLVAMLALIIGFVAVVFGVALGEVDWITAALYVGVMWIGLHVIHDEMAREDARKP